MFVFCCVLPASNKSRNDDDDLHNEQQVVGSSYGRTTSRNDYGQVVHTH